MKVVVTLSAVVRVAVWLFIIGIVLGLVVSR
jgi:hypothetical protein